MKALLDADILVYRVGFASEGEEENIALARCTEMVTDIVFFEANCDSYDGFLTGKGNYRYDIAKNKPYKGNRKAAKPKHYEALRNHLVKMGCVVIEGQEADDALGIAACSSKRDEFILITTDKDLNMIPGKHYNFVKKEFADVTDEMAIKFFYTQLLTGDATDNIQGVEGIGPKKAEKALQGAETEEDMYKVAQSLYNDDALLLENARLLWIRREPGQMWTPPG